jgi:hypothetical protein
MAKTMPKKKLRGDDDDEDDGGRGKLSPLFLPLESTATSFMTVDKDDPTAVSAPKRRSGKQEMLLSSSSFVVIALLPAAVNISPFVALTMHIGVRLGVSKGVEDDDSPPSRLSGGPPLKQP